MDGSLNTFTLIYNPAAGKGTAQNLLPKVQTLLAQHKLEYRLQLTQAAGHARQIAQAAAEAGDSMIVAAGGDGTINETINGILSADMQGASRPVLGVLPVGTGNDFAFGVGIPNELGQAIQVLAEGRTRSIDIGRVVGGDFPQGRFFGNGVGMGFDTVVGLEAAKIKWLQGAASYLAGLVRTIFLYSKAPVYEICLDDKEPIVQAFLMISVMNGIRMGGAFYMAPEGNPGDGVFDLCLANQVPQIKILPLAAKFMKGAQKGHPAVSMVQARRVSVRAIEGTIPAHADGETICVAGSKLAIEIFPSAINVVTASHA